MCKGECGDHTPFRHTPRAGDNKQQRDESVPFSCLLIQVFLLPYQKDNMMSVTDLQTTITSQHEELMKLLKHPE